MGPSRRLHGSSRHRLAVLMQLATRQTARLRELHGGEGCGEALRGCLTVDRPVEPYRKPCPVSIPLLVAQLAGQHGDRQ